MNIYSASARHCDLRLFCCAASFAAFIGVTVSATAASAQPVDACVTKDVVKLQEYAGLIHNIVPWVGIEAGIFDRHCLEIIMVPISSGPAAYAASLQGGVDFISTAPETLLVPYSQGMNVKFVAGINTSIHYAMVVRPDLDLPSEAEGFPAVMKDLVGKRIGVNALGSTTHALARTNFVAAGINPDEANWVAYGAPAAGFAALENGTLDAIEVFSDGMDIAAAITGGKIIGDLRDPTTASLPIINKMRGVSLSWAAQSSYIEKNREVVNRFVIANSEAIGWARNPGNFEEVLRLVRENAPSPEGVEDSEGLLLTRVNGYLPQLNDKLSVSSLEAWAQFALDNGRIPEPVNMGTLIWEGSASLVVP